MSIKIPKYVESKVEIIQSDQIDKVSEYFVVSYLNDENKKLLIRMENKYFY